MRPCVGRICQPQSTSAVNGCPLPWCASNSGAGTCENTTTRTKDIFMSNKGRWIKLLGTATVVAAALAGGISASRVFFAPGVEKLLSKAEAAYAKGVDALDQGDTTTAAIRFEEANLQANKLLDAIAKEGQQASEETTARLDPIE